MPSVSPKQRKLMNIAAHTPGGYGGVPQKVGEEFHAADKKEGYFGGNEMKREEAIKKSRRRPLVHTAGNTSKQRSGKSRSWTGA